MNAAAADYSDALPPAARTKATRLRWRQGATSVTQTLYYATGSNVWSLDNIFIGAKNSSLATNGTAFSEM